MVMTAMMMTIKVSVMVKVVMVSRRRVHPICQVLVDLVYACIVLPTRYVCARVQCNAHMQVLTFCALSLAILQFCHMSNDKKDGQPLFPSRLHVCPVNNYIKTHEALTKTMVSAKQAQRL